MERPQKHIDFLDQFRGVAIIAVFLFHSMDAAFGRAELKWDGWFRDFHVAKTFLYFLPLSFGWAGVAIFFVVSGFCIHLSFTRKPDWTDFWVRRFFRIYPPYFFAVILFALLIPWSRVENGLHGVAQLIDHFALIHNFNEESYYGINPAFWSIAVEVQLYFLYPVLLALVARFGWRRSLTFIASLEITLRAISSLVFVTTNHATPLWFSGLPFFYWFSWSIGAAVADAYHRGHPLPFSNHSLLAWTAVAFGSCFVKPLSSFSFLFFALLTAVAIAKLIKRERPIRIPLISASLRTVGLWSFSIYLLHHPFLLHARRLAAQFPQFNVPGPLLAFLVCLCLWFPIMALSAIWYRSFEVPCIAVGRRIAAHAHKFIRQPIPRSGSIIATVGKEKTSFDSQV